MTYDLGVDLGTTHTAAAVRHGDRVEVLRLGGRRSEIPSLVFVPADGPALVGEPAARRGREQPGRLVREVKRRLGDPVPILVGGSPFSAHALLARQLAHVLTVATTARQGPPSRVVLTCPANWGPYKRDLLRQAARLADAPEVELRTEPEAAAIEYAAGEHMAPGDVVAVYDLGGGTFDAAVLRRTPGGFDLLGTPEGIEQLGGADFDEAVFAHVTALLPADHLTGDDPATIAALAQLRHECVAAKEALSFDTETSIPVALPGLHTQVRLTRRELEVMIAPVLEDTVNALRRALRSARIEPARVKAVLLSGGSSRIPLVGAMVSEALNRPVVVDPHPEHSIALGAARLTAPAAGPPPTPSASTGPAASSAGASSFDNAVTTDISDMSPEALTPGGPWRRNRVLVAAFAILVILVLVPGGLWLSRDDPGGDDEVAAPPSASASGPVACGFVDEFDGGALDPAWERTRTDTRIVVGGGAADIDAPEGSDLYTGFMTAPRLLRPVTGDFVLEATLDAAPAIFYQAVGLLLWVGPQRYVRIERGFGAQHGTMAFEYRDGGVHQRVHGPLPDQKPVRADATRVVVRMSRAGGTVTAAWRPVTGAGFAGLGSAKLTLPATVAVGVSVLNRAQFSAKPTPFHARVERVSLDC